MEADQSFKHFCKLCNQKFRCGRSLGGHMRSHLTNTEPEFNTSLSRANNGESNSNNVKSIASSSYSAYGLRENPKRNSKHRNPEKFCRECGKGFQSWKALFGHMKCHSEKKKSSINTEDRESWSYEYRKMMIMDSQSDTEFSAPDKKKRSSRRRLRYSKTPPSSSSSFSIAKASSSASEIDQEQEEIALSLIMLSRDSGHWGRINSTAESSDNISNFSDVLLFDPKNFVQSKQNMELDEMDSGNLGFLEKQSEFEKKSEFDGRVGMKTSDTKLGKSTILKIEKCSSRENSELKFRSKTRKISKIHNPDSENCRNSHKRSKFECSSCRKVFHSYQALGGHKTSHRKIKSCFQSTIEVENENLIINPETSELERRRKMHPCPICCKMFSSGQALGGHKRSHLLACPKNMNNQTIVTGDKISEIREFFDLNLQACVDEESSNTLVDSLDSCWVRGVYESERLLRTDEELWRKNSNSKS